MKNLYNKIKISILIYLVLVELVLGASYTGRNAQAAAGYIDRSQGVAPWKYVSKGHPRGHAADSGRSTGRSGINTVQDYSRGSTKSGFLSRADQDSVVHKALSHTMAKSAMARLNRGSKREVVTIPAASIGVRMNGGEWKNGNQVKNSAIRSVTLVLGHFNGRQKQKNAPVHITTAYPRI